MFLKHCILNAVFVSGVAAIINIHLGSKRFEFKTLNALSSLADANSSATSNHFHEDLLCSELHVLTLGTELFKNIQSEDMLISVLHKNKITTSDYRIPILFHEVIEELDTKWEEAVLKWRRKALAVEKYRCTNPQYLASIYTYMVNTCIMQGHYEVAYDALTYAGLPPAGPFFVKSNVEMKNSSKCVTFNVDKMSAYIAEQILDMDLDLWRQKSRELGIISAAVSAKAIIGIEESNFRQNDQCTSQESALRVQDMILAVVRVALRELLPKFKTGGAYEEQNLVIFSSCTEEYCDLHHIIIPANKIDFLLQYDTEISLVSKEIFEELDGKSLSSYGGYPLLLTNKQLIEAKMR